MPRCLILTNQLFLHNNSMKKILSLSLILMITLSAYGETFEGGVSERGSALHSSRIIDKDTGRGIGGAKITLPKQNYQTKTNKDGYFEFDSVPVGEYEVYTVLENGEEYIFKTIKINENVEVVTKLKYDPVKTVAAPDEGLSTATIIIIISIVVIVLAAAGVTVLILWRKKHKA